MLDKTSRPKLVQHLMEHHVMKTLYNDAFSSLDCIVFIEIIMIGKDVEWKDHGLIWDNMLEFAWWGCWKPQKSSIKIAETQARIWNCNLLNMILRTRLWCYVVKFRQLFNSWDWQLEECIQNLGVGNLLKSNCWRHWEGDGKVPLRWSLCNCDWRWVQLVQDDNIIKM